MGLTEFLRVVLFVLAVVVVCLAGFWIISEAAKRGYSPVVVKIAAGVLALIAILVLILRFAGDVVPR